MGIRAWVGMKRAQRMFKRTARELAGTNPVMQKKLMNLLVSKVRDLARRNITTQGNGSWRPLSKWTVAQTGRRKALVTLRKHIVAIKARGRGTTASVVFNSPGDFSLNQHHDGFKDPATGGVVKIALKKPAALNLPKKTTVKAFVDRHSRDVPARRVWPEGRKLFIMLRNETRKWAREMDRRNRRS